MNKIHQYNERIFDSWTEESAYLLGWLITDGCVQYVPNKRYGLRWELADKDAVEMIRDILQATNNIYDRPKDTVNLYSIYIRGEYITRRVMNLGISPRKTHTIKFPPVPLCVMRHFIRGIMDGDGSVMLLNKKYGKQLSTKFCSASKDFINELGNVLRRELGLIPKIYEEQPGFYVLKYGANESFALLKYLYDDCKYYLARKRDKFMEASNIKCGSRVSTCMRCGKEIVRTSNRQKWCNKCNTAVMRERDRKRHRTHDE